MSGGPATTALIGTATSGSQVSGWYLRAATIAGSPVTGRTRHAAITGLKGTGDKPARRTLCLFPTERGHFRLSLRLRSDKEMASTLDRNFSESKAPQQARDSTLRLKRLVPAEKANRSSQKVERKAMENDISEEDLSLPIAFSNGSPRD
jgi:hypothetical protein